MAPNTRGGYFARLPFCPGTPGSPDPAGSHPAAAPARVYSTSGPSALRRGGHFSRFRSGLNARMETRAREGVCRRTPSPQGLVYNPPSAGKPRQAGLRNRAGLPNCQAESLSGAARRSGGCSAGPQTSARGVLRQEDVAQVLRGLDAARFPEWAGWRTLSGTGRGFAPKGCSIGGKRIV